MMICLITWGNLRIIRNRDKDYLPRFLGLDTGGNLVMT